MGSHCCGIFLFGRYHWLPEGILHRHCFFSLTSHTLITAPTASYLVERIHPGALGSIDMVLFCIGLFSLSTLTTHSSNISLILLLALCGAGFGIFQTPNNSTIISSTTTHRSGGASGMLGMARL